MLVCFAAAVEGNGARAFAGCGWVDLGKLFFASVEAVVTLVTPTDPSDLNNCCSNESVRRVLLPANTLSLNMRDRLQETGSLCLCIV